MALVAPQTVPAEQHGYGLRRHAALSHLALCTSDRVPSHCDAQLHIEGAPRETGLLAGEGVVHDRARLANAALSAPAVVPCHPHECTWRGLTVEAKPEAICTSRCSACPPGIVLTAHEESLFWCTVVSVSQL